MPQAVVVAVPTPVTWGTLVEVARSCFGDRVRVFERQIQVEVGEDHVIVSPVTSKEEYASEYAMNEDLAPHFRAQSRELSYYTVQFHGLQLVKNLLTALLTSLDSETLNSCWVDTDYGWVAHASKLLTAITTDLNYDWRTGEPNL